MATGAPMTGGTGIDSYANNSQFQREEFNSAKNLINDALIQNLDVENIISSTSNTFAIADLGCSVGPNTFLAMENMVYAIEEKYHAQGHDATNLEFQVFFNDQVGNDFNTLFASLPNNKRYYAAGVPGSFWGRLFPNSSICLAYSSASLHWISMLPKALVDKNSPAWNKGKIHYTGAKDEVVKAYAEQFDEDMDVFLNARAEEIVQGGMLVIISPGVPDESTAHYIGVTFSFCETIILDMVKETTICNFGLSYWALSFTDFHTRRHIMTFLTKESKIRDSHRQLQKKTSFFVTAVGYPDHRLPLWDLSPHGFSILGVPHELPTLTGLIKQDEVDSFNIPQVYPSVKQMSDIVRKNGCFSIVKVELRNARTDPNSPIDHAAVALSLRAMAGGTFSNHFGNKIVDEFFVRVTQKISNLFSMLDASGAEIGMQLFTVLMRK